MTGKKLWLIDAGHGGIDKDGKYTTAPAKMFTFTDGFTILEGVVNRLIARKLVQRMEANGMDYQLVYNEMADIPLRTRVERCNNAYKKNKKAVLISLHSNSTSKTTSGHGSLASGFEVFTSKGQTLSDSYAEIICSHIEKDFPEYPLRKDTSDKDKDKEADFFILKYSLCPAVLIESLFFDNRKEAEFLLSEYGQEKIASTLCKALLECETL